MTIENDAVCILIGRGDEEWEFSSDTEGISPWAAIFAVLGGLKNALTMVVVMVLLRIGYEAAVWGFRINARETAARTAGTRWLFS